MKDYKVIRVGNAVHIFKRSGFLLRFDPTQISREEFSEVVNTVKDALWSHEEAYAKMKEAFKREQTTEE